MPGSAELLDRLKAALGPAGVLEGAEAAEKATGWSRMGIAPGGAAPGHGR